MKELEGGGVHTTKHIQSDWGVGSDWVIVVIGWNGMI